MTKTDSPMQEAASAQPASPVSLTSARTSDVAGAQSEIKSVTTSTTPATPLELTLLELAAELRLKDEQDAGRRANLEAEIVKLREQRASLYDPSVKD